MANHSLQKPVVTGVYVFAYLCLMQIRKLNGAHGDSHGLYAKGEVSKDAAANDAASKALRGPESWLSSLSRPRPVHSLDPGLTSMK